MFSEIGQLADIIENLILFGRSPRSLKFIRVITRPATGKSSRTLPSGLEIPVISTSVP